MSDPFVSEIRLLPYSYAPKGWARCDGQIMPIAQNNALAALLSTHFGGDGKTTFALPYLRDVVPVGIGEDGQGNSYSIGETGGQTQVPLQESELGAHAHKIRVSTRPAKSRQPVGSYFAVGTGVAMYDVATKAPTNMSERMMLDAGGGLPHNNLMPFIAVPYCIALQGVFPPRA